MDTDRAKAFMSTMVNMMNAGSAAMMVSIGHRTGLFDSMATLSSVTSEQLATAADLNERYVREWLAAMASAGVVDFDADDNTFTLPEEHQALVTRSGGPLNLASTMQTIAHLGSVEDDVVEAFKTGAGVPYSRYTSFTGWMAEESAARFDAALLSEVVPAIDGAHEALSSGASLADIGCGTGHALLILAAEYPASTFVGIDFSQEAIDIATERAGDRGLENVSFIVSDAAQIDLDARFDFITTFDAIHDQAKPAAVLSNIAQALRTGGTYLCVEPKAHSSLVDNMAEPAATFQYTISTMHCMSVSIAGGGTGLGTAWGTELTTEFLNNAGFDDVEVVKVRSDRTNSYFVCQMS